MTKEKERPAQPDLFANEAELVKNAGAGFLSDMARQAAHEGGALELTAEEAKNSGAGFIQDVLRAPDETDGGETPPDGSGEFSTPVLNIQNANEPAVTVNADDFPRFPVASTVRFESTGNAMLDAPQADFYVLSVNQVGKTFKINADLSDESAPIKQGVIFTDAAKSAAALKAFEKAERKAAKRGHK